MAIISGIYRIVNKANNHHYIGSSWNIHKRWGDHKRSLANRSHHSRYLQRAWNKYGEEQFEFEIVLICEVDDLLIYEQKYLDHFPCEYNICKFADSNRGVEITEETRKKLRESHLGQTPWNKGISPTDEVREKYRRAHDGKSSEDYYWYGKRRRPETIEKIAAKRRGVPLSEEHKEKISEALTGITRSTETRQRMSIAQRGENCPTSKLTESEVLFIRSMAAEAEFERGDKMDFYRFWAHKYNVTYGAIKSIVIRKTWKHI